MTSKQSIDFSTCTSNGGARGSSTPPLHGFYALRIEVLLGWYLWHLTRTLMIYVHLDQNRGGGVLVLFLVSSPRAAISNLWFAALLVLSKAPAQQLTFDVCLSVCPFVRLSVRLLQHFLHDKIFWLKYHAYGWYLCSRAILSLHRNRYNERFRCRAQK